MEIHQVEVGLLTENIDSNNSSDTNENDKSSKTKAEDKEVKLKQTASIILLNIKYIDATAPIYNIKKRR